MIANAYDGLNKIKITYQQFVNSNIHFPSGQSSRKARPLNKTAYNSLPKQHSLRDNNDGLEKPLGSTQAVGSRGQETWEKKGMTIQKVYHAKKTAYKNYIRQIYNRINEELKKKNNFLTIASQNIKHVDYHLSLTTKEVKIFKADSQKTEEKEESYLKSKLKEKLRLRKVEDDSSSIEKIKMKLISMKKEEELERKEFDEKMQKLTKAKTQRQDKLKQILQKEPSMQLKPRQKQLIRDKRKQRIYSLNATAHNFQISPKINPEEYITNTFLFKKKDPFVCGLNQKGGVYERAKEKILNYIDFLWKINYSNGLFVKSQPQEVVYKAYVGGGNNSLMIKSIIKRRFWWTIVDKAEGSNFVWTQLKVNSIFKDHQKHSKNKKQLIYPFKVEESAPLTEEEDGMAHSNIFNPTDLQIWAEHTVRNGKNEVVINERTYMKRLDMLVRKRISKVEDSCKLVVHNHLQQNYYIGNKKALFYNMRKYYSLRGLNVFESLPLTFHISRGTEDPQYKVFYNYYCQLEERKKKGEQQKNMWIIKPGEFSNRGNGISVCYSLDDILLRLKSKEKSSDGNPRTFILQKYIEKPLLYKSRKFDIRHYMLLTCFNGVMKAYWYPQGYIRTASSLFSLKRNANLFVHLTNDAVQKNSDQYGKYEKGNKISYDKFQSYLDKTIKTRQEKNLFYDYILPQMRELARIAVKSSYFLLDSKRRQHNFQLLGMDFMIDLNLKPWLIEINTNPCLELSSPLLGRLIPSLVENVFKICVDPFFPPPEQWQNNKKFTLGENTLLENRFELIFDESVDGREIEELYGGDFKVDKNMGKIEQDAQIYENDGVEEWQGELSKKESEKD